MNAEQAFMDSMAQARSMANAIAQRVDDHLLVDPFNVKWANVADANRLIGDLTKIAEYLFGNEAQP